ncbi:zinc finger bed domain-containing protein 4-like [Gigaspora margarita]|uniref:Zinc finger bed domain-containing protein 4-like n=1 Tax=Gigaspora margarita TaxID=4874 RepID=A0A8H4AJV7_GIGMA|nr:zinc finger bed domain-containing protein 4-like [Gigaspora margarita]
MTANNENQGLIQISGSNNENNLLISESNGTQQSSQHTENNDKRSICWKYFEPFKVPKRGETTKCTIDGCNKKYIWRGSTSNLVGHLKTKHDITSMTAIQPTITKNNFRNFELDVNLPVIKFIVSSVLPFNIVDNLKSSGIVNQHITSSIIEKQIDKVYNRLFSQLKSKIQQAKFVTFSVSWIKVADEVFDVVITYDWLTEDFEFRKILLHIGDFDDSEEYILADNINKTLDKWELTNLKFINCIRNEFEIYDLPENIIIYENEGDGNDLIEYSLRKWAKKNNNTQEMSNIITAIMNATSKLCRVVTFLKDNRTQRIMNNVQIAEKLSCNCHYHKIEFLALIEQPFKMLINDHSNSNDNFIRENVSNLRSFLLDKLPFSIFPELLRLFKPLEHVKVVTMRILRDMLINAFNILNETSQYVVTTYQYYWELETLKSFLTFLINSYLDFHQRVGLFLDPNSKSFFINDSAVKKLVLDECQDYYSKIDNNSIQELANGELERYNMLPQVLIKEDDPCKWWQKSKHLYPGLATLAIKYLPLLNLDDKKVSLENHNKFRRAYHDNYETINKIAFLQYNMKYINL